MNTEENMTEQEETNKMSHEPHRPHEPHAPMRFLLLLLPLLLACSEGSETPSSQESQEPQDATPIAFTGSLGAAEAVTRATTQPLEAKTHTFTVYGYKNTTYDPATHSFDGLQTVMPAFVVNWQDNSVATTTTNTQGWEYVGQAADQTVKYWDWGATAYRFFATAESHAYDSTKETAEQHAAHTPQWATPSAQEPQTITVTLAADASSDDAITATPYYAHLWFSTGDPVAFPDKLFGRPVLLEFVKPFTRVRFLFKYAYPREGIELEGKSFRPTDSSKKIARKGTVSVIYPLTGTETHERFASVPDAGDAEPIDEFAEDFDPEDDGKTYTETDHGWYMVLPNPDNAETYTLQVKVNGETKIASVPAEYMQWLPGYSYTYIFKITDEGGVEIGGVEYAATPWVDMETDWTVYNW